MNIKELSANIVLQFQADDFNEACINGDLDAAKELYNKNLIVNASAILSQTCTNGHTEVAKWLYNLGFRMHDHEMRNAFVQTCNNGHLETAKWMYSLDETLIYSYICKAFVDAYKTNIVHIANWIYTIDPIILVHCMRTVVTHENVLIIDNLDKNLLHELGLDDDTIEDLSNIQYDRPIKNTDNIKNIVVLALFEFNRVDELERLNLPFVSYTVTNGIGRGHIRRLKAKSAAKII